MSSPWRATMALIAVTGMMLLGSPTYAASAQDVHESTVEVDTALPSDFVSTWDTRNLSVGSSGLNQISLPVHFDYYPSYNFTVDWGDGTSSVVTNANQAEATHTYTTPGEYTLTIAGDLHGWAFANGGDRLKIGNVAQWGDINFGNNGHWFNGASNLTATATDSPDLTGTTNMSWAFQRASSFNGQMNNWDTGAVTDMTGAFYEATAFNQDIGAWDVGNVNSMLFMFQGATAFNQDIGAWDVSNVTNFRGMFTLASKFNQDIGGWNTTNAVSVESMFAGAKAFNQDIGGWVTSNVGNMEWMLQGASSFNQDIGGWDVGRVTNMAYLFQDASSFNQDIGGWNTNRVTSMRHMFWGASAFNQNVGLWDVSRVADMESMFSGVGLSLQNYDALLMGWASLPSLQNDVPFNAGSSRYTDAAQASRQILTGTYGWTVTDGGIAYPGFGAAPSSLGFGEQMVGTTSAARAVTITNTGDAPLVFGAGAVSLKGDGAGQFEISADTCSSESVSPQSTCAVTVLFSPTSVGTSTATLSFTDNAPDSPHTVGLSGAGVQIPGAPTGVTASRGDKKLSVSWDAPADDSGLPISKYVATAAPGGATCETSGDLSCEITGLTNGTAYTVTVVAFNDAGAGPASDPSTPVAPGTAPSAPQDVTAVRGDKKASVSWKPPVDDGGFAVTGYAATAQPGGATCSTDGDGRDCEITGLTNGSTYTVHITATNAIGTSTDAVADVTPATTPSAPSGVTATPGFRKAVVSWQASASNGGDPILGYTVVANPGGRTCTAVGGQCVVTGLNDFGTYTFSVTARNSVGDGPASEPSAAITLSGDEAVARLTVGTQVNIGEPMALDAAASTSLSGQIATYEWDFGDGSFTMGGSTASHVWAQRGVKTVRVRVTSAGGMTDIATTSVEVFARSAREPGVSIDQGAPYTRSRDVTLTLGWPDKARQARISNDGGFADAQTVDVDDAIPWVLDDSVEVVATQVVYVRFLGPGVDESRMFSDNIIFDNTAPALSKVTAVPKTVTTKSASLQATRDAHTLAARKRVWRVSVKARDDRSGMGRLKVNTSRRSKGAVSVRYRQKARVKLAGGSRKVFVRVSDKAGNWTKWKKAKVIVRRR